MRILKGLLSPVDVLAAREAVVEALASIERADAVVRRIYQTQGGIRLSLLRSAAIDRIIAELEHKFRLRCYPTRSSAREQKPTGVHKLPWHQDYAPMELQPGQAGTVAWVPLDSIDGTRPSLEVAPTEEPFSHHRDGRRFLAADEEKERLGAVVIRDMHPGDVLEMSPYEPHRTYCDASMTSTRLSLDLRFF